jgi:photosystem II stability/assembly factor-like uncharacterized protein
MKNGLLLFIALIITALPLKAQSDDWEWQNPLPQGNDLNSVYFVDSNTGWAVGNFGTIIKTTDAGENWLRQESNINSHLLCCYFMNNNTGFAAGDSGIVLKTDDGGNNWRTVACLMKYTYSSKIKKISFIDSKTGYISGLIGTYKTTDTGESWEKLNISGKSHCFVDKDYGIIVGNPNGVSRTTDAGLTWINCIGKQYSPDFEDVHFIDYDTGFAISKSDNIYKTTDKGNTWNEFSYLFNGEFYDLFFLDSNYGWAVGSFDEFIYTTDKGESWKTKELPAGDWNPQINFYSIFFTDSKTGWIVGSKGMILHTTNAGDSWKQQSTRIVDSLSDIFILDSNVVYCTGEYGAILKTTNGGIDWTWLKSGTKNHLLSIDFFDNKIGWASGKNGTIIKTTDGGINWFSCKSNVNSDLYDIIFADSLKGWCKGNDDLILFTSDGGLNWEKSLLDSINDPHLIFVDKDNGFLIRNGSTIFRTSDRGDNWNKIKELPGYIFLNSCFVDSMTVWLAYFNSNSFYLSFLITTDCGLTWKEENHDTKINYSFSSFSFTDSLEGFYISYDYVSNTNIDNREYYNRFSKTTNGGKSWESKLLLTKNKLSKIAFKGKNNGWIIGKNTILKYKPKEINKLIPVVNISPTNGIKMQNNEIELNWSRALKNCAYRLQVATDKNFQNIVNDIEIYSNFYTLSKLLYSTEYFWRVQYSNEKHTSEWSITWSFETMPQDSLRGAFEWQIPELQFGFNNITFSDKNTWWVVGKGILMKTTNNGLNWSYDKNIIGYNINKVLFLNENLGFLICEKGVILKTTDNGKKWKEFKSSLGNLIGIYFIDNNNGWIWEEKGRLLKTTNCGDSWIYCLVSEDNELKDIHFINNDNGWVLNEDGSINRTTDGGKSWGPNEYGKYHLQSVLFFNNKIGFAFADHIIYDNDTDVLIKTTDGGYSWHSPLIRPYGKFFFLDSLNGWIFDYEKVLWKTKDGGNTWINYGMIKTFNGGSFCFSDTLNGISINGTNTLSRTTDGGVTWFIIINHDKRLIDISSINKNVAYASGFNGLIMKTTNGGNDWVKLQTNSNEILGNLFFIDEKRGWVTEGGESILKTTDGGNTWERFQINKTYFRKLLFMNDTLGFGIDVSYPKNNIVKTTDGGKSWSDIYKQNPIRDFQYLGNNMIWAVGLDGIVVNSQNGGDSWKEYKIDCIRFNSLYFLNPLVGWVSGDCLYKTSDGGLIWDKISNSSFNKIVFIDENIGYNNIIEKTTDGGRNWFKIFPESFYKFEFVDKNNAWFGNEENILKYTGSESVSVEEKQPEAILARNDILIRPNPANDFLNVIVNLDSDDKYEMSVFNLMGMQFFRERVTNTGTSNRHIDISYLPAGIYFLRLHQNDIDIVKKFIKN